MTKNGDTHLYWEGNDKRKKPTKATQKPSEKERTQQKKKHNEELERWISSEENPSVIPTTYIRQITTTPVSTTSKDHPSPPPSTCMHICIPLTTQAHIIEN